MKKYLPVVLITSAVFLFFFLLFSSADVSKAAPATNVVISEIQTEGTNPETSATITGDEFVELYNPTDTAIDLTGWELVRKTAATSAAEQLLVELTGTIPAKGFFLITHTDYDGTTSTDMSYSGIHITINNSVALKDDTGTIIDLVGMGTSNTFEGQTVLNPIPNRSIERKANEESTSESMRLGGTDELLGNAWDTNNNANDFIRYNDPIISDPQNSQSQAEPQENITPTATPTDEPTATPTEGPTATPTEDPDPTVTPTLTLTDTPTPTVSPAPTTQPAFIFPQLQIVCTPKITTLRIFGILYNFEFPSCKVIRTN